MADDTDQAQKFDETFLAEALAAHCRNRIAGVSATHCEDCEEPIPEARRAAASGCTRCVACQTKHENWRPM